LLDFTLGEVPHNPFHVKETRIYRALEVFSPCLFLQL
jgi:hypothetical protein